MEALYQDRIEEQVNVLYYHFSEAENWPKAVRYGRQAADKASRLNQYGEAVQMFEQTRECLLGLPEDRARQQTLVDLQLAMLWPLYHSGQLDRLMPICKEAESVARTLKDRVRLGKVYWGYGIYTMLKGEHRKTEPNCLRALELLEGSREDSLITFIKYWLASSYNSLGMWKKAEPLYLESIRSQEEQETQTDYIYKGLGFLPYAYGCALLGYNLGVQGRTKQAKELFEKSCMPAVKQASNLYTKTGCAVWHSRFSALIGEDHGAMDRADEVLVLAEEADSPIFRFRGHDAKGNALMAVGEFEAARGVFEQASRILEGKSYRVGLAGVYYSLVQINLELGSRAQAEQYYQAALPLVQSNLERIAPRFDFLKGRLLASDDPLDFEQAEVYFNKSIRADEASGARALAAQTRFYLAQMLAHKGEVERSQTLLTELRGQFQSWRIPAWQQKCELLLE
jgi:tetratricopeptide (TPR) repeat protein